MTPDFQITANGRDISASLKDRLLRLTVTDESGIMSDKVEITLDDRDYRLAFPPTGAKIEVYMGYVGDLTRMGAYVVDTISISGPPDQIQIVGHAIDYRGPVATRKEKSWHKTTLGGIVQGIAAEHGFAAKVDPSIAGIEVAHEDQMESDLQFLSRLALENNALFKPADGNFVFMPRAPSTSQGGRALEPLTLDRGSLDNWSAEMIHRGEVTKVSASYQDRRGAKRTSVNAGGSGGRTVRLSTTYPTEQAARLAAESRLAAINFGAMEMTCTASVGDPRLRAERKVSLTGMRPGLNTSWVITSATHTLESGYSTALKLEKV